MRYKDITTRCGSMLSLGMRFTRKSRDKTRTLHACVWRVLCDLMNLVKDVCIPCCVLCMVCVLSR